ncbi:Sterol regulatory element-binding protein 1-like protein 2 [Paraphaeosphaeria minitans]|uniref:Sterol regulatory element-binding protein 1-like protein 2 n=1 Tax=Paraphaeosphaeria minitans TaxID=565426 RepID=A0A9P6GRK9_9PLEO|nr:Sterol regulatory element-binding protein 1-like protein 2 [Paraphaeosphaeria minitans]
MASPYDDDDDDDGDDEGFDHGLELERIAVGPYCVFDSFRPSLSPQPSRTRTRTPPPHSASKERMEDPLMASAFQFEAAGIRPPWLTTAPDDLPLAAPAPSWNDFMTWDPNVSQGPDVKLSGPACPLKPELQRPPLFNRRHSSQSRHPSVQIQGTNPPSTAAMLGPTHNPPFTFGQNPELPPAFDFDTQTLSSPPVDGHHHGTFYPTQMAWPQHMDGNTLFSPPRFEPTALPSASDPPLSNPPSLQHSHSPSSIHNAGTSSSSGHSTPEPASDNPKKRKSSTDEDSAPSGKREKHLPPKKTAHNMIEKRYRTNLNDKIAALRDSVPSLRVMSRGAGANEEDDDPEDLEGLTPAHKLNKATVLSKATEYIRHLEKRNKRLQDEVATLQGRIESYEKMAISGPMTLHGPMGTPDGNRYQHEDPFTPSHSMSMSGPPQGMIPVPDHIAQMRQGLQSQPHYAHAYPPYAGASRPGPPMVNGRRNNSMVGKLMVGSLAGLMILEGLGEREQSQEDSDGRGLFAVPFNLATILAPRVALGATSAQFPLAKLLLIFGAVFWIIAPLFDFSPKSKKKTSSAIHLARAPSLASPVEVRHRAWLTAIQTVWVPRHNFVLEVAALSLKILKLSTRKLIGWPHYAFLSGTTKEHEAARIKAWSIALDAQLTGGDAEISKSRLVLTLMASGTLPDTPERLMLKSLHLRVLLWELANAGHGLSWIMGHVSAKLAQRYWNMARSEHRIATNLASKPDSDAQPLPDHLAALLEKKCDEIFSFPIIQRAYNLAWNRPVAEHTSADPCVDGVVGDSAISSPLDALAAWYSSLLLRQTLAESLHDGQSTDSVSDALTLSARIAPPNSQAHLRALAAKAVVVEEDRATHIAAAFAALPTPSNASSSGTKLINLVSGAPAAVDVRKALTLAKCLTLVDSSHEEARRQAIFVVNNTYLTEVTTTLLSFVAGHKILERFIQDPALQAETTYGLERLAGSLRMWVGHDTGRRNGLDNKTRGRVVKRCLDASKMLVGLADREDFDPGYFSSSAKDDDISP